MHIDLWTAYLTAQNGEQVHSRWLNMAGRVERTTMPIGKYTWTYLGRITGCQWRRLMTSRRSNYTGHVMMWNGYSIKCWDRIWLMFFERKINDGTLYTTCWEFKYGDVCVKGFWTLFLELANLYRVFLISRRVLSRCQMELNMNWYRCHEWHGCKACYSR